MSKYRLLIRHPLIRAKLYPYDLAKACNAKVAVETGVYGGISSLSILQAMEDIGSGHLYSIDLPEIEQPMGGYSPLPKGRQTGWLVPERLKHRWTLILGDARVELPKLVSTLNSIDFFHHDSLHSYEHMKFEFETVWPKLRRGGIIASDDVNFNSAFSDFCASHGLTPKVSKGLATDWGYAVK